MNLTVLPESPFYKAGGNLSPDDLCYVNRPADMELFEAVGSGQYCYVLTSRQMGKSSLMHRTAVRLRGEGITPVVVDLTGIGTQVTPEQWYFGMLAEIARQLSLSAEMQAYWDENSRHSPLYRFTHAMVDIVVAMTETPLVVFIDEIDSVASIKKSFSTDEFFAAIRQCYNSRASTPEMKRLTFCLLGVSTPADLIQDPSTTPFNIGRQIELTDFTFTEAEHLISGLDDNMVDARLKLERIFHWSNGHPYLTQKLCLEVSRNPDRGVAYVDELCQQLFLANRVRTSEDNLIFVHKLLRSRADTVDNASMLRLYRSVLAGKRVANVPSDPLIAHLRLAGVVGAEDGFLCSRNLIYKRVFDTQWVIDNMPDAELKRERAAYRRGVLRTIAVLAIVIGAILAALIVSLWSLRDSNYRRALGDMTQAQEAIQEPDLGRAEKLLKEAVKLGGPGMSDRFSWRYLWRASHQEERTMTCGGSVLAVAALPDGKTAAAIVDDGSLQLWDSSTGVLLRRYPLGLTPTAAAFSDDKVVVVVGVHEGSIAAYNVSTGIRYASVDGTGDTPNVVSIADNHRTVVASFQNDGVRVIDLAARQTLQRIPNPSGNVAFAVAVSCDAKVFAVGYFNGEILYGPIGQRTRRIASAFHFAITSLRYSNDGNELAAGDFDGHIRLFDTSTGNQIRRMEGNRAKVSDVCFVKSSRTLITTGFDSQLHIWHLPTGQSIGRLAGHHDNVTSLAAFANGTIVSGSSDGTMKVWNIPVNPMDAGVNLDIELDGPVNSMPTNQYALVPLKGTTACLMDLDSGRPIWRIPGTGTIMAWALSPDRTLIFIARNGVLEVWSVADQSMVRRFEEHAVVALALSKDAKYLAVGRRDQTIDVFNTSNWQVSHVSTAVNGILSLAFASHSDRLAVGGSSAFVDILSIPRGDRIARLSTGMPIIDNVVFSPDAALLATNGCHAVTILWDTRTWKRIREIQTPPDVAPGAFIFAPNGAEIATGDGNGGVKLWNVGTGDEIASLNNQPPCIDSMGFSPDGKRLAAIAGTRLTRWYAPPVPAAEMH